MDNILNVWGKGQLFTFSGLAGDTDFDAGMVLRSSGHAGFEIKIPNDGGRIKFHDNTPEKCILASDAFKIDDITGVFADCHHLLLQGEIAGLELSDALTAQKSGDKTLIGVKKYFRAELLKLDIETLFIERMKFFDRLMQLSAGNDAEVKTLFKAYSQLKGQIYAPCGKIPYYWSTPDRWPHRSMWLWDSVFHALGMQYIDKEKAVDLLLAVLEFQQNDGFIPHMMNPNTVSDVTQPPVLAWGFSEILAKDDLRLKAIFPKLEKYVEWILTNRDVNHNGLYEWYIHNTPECRCGESGMDNSPRFDLDIRYDAVDLNAYLSKECEVLSEFAGRLNLPERSKFWHERHKNLNALINRYLWSNTNNLYMDYDAEHQQLSPIESSAGFLPLFCGAPTPDMAAAMAALLEDEKSFKTPLRIPSISCKCEKYYKKDMWRGPVWNNINFLIINGLERYGYTDLAAEIRDETMKIQEKYYLKYGTFFEFMDDRQELEPPELLRKEYCIPDSFNQVFHDFGWSATLYIAMSAQKNNKF